MQRFVLRNEKLWFAVETETEPLHLNHVRTNGFLNRFWFLAISLSTEYFFDDAQYAWV